MSQTILLIRNTHPEFYGGAETYQLTLATELKKHGYRPIIVTSSRELLKHAAAAHITAVQAPYLRQQNWSGWRNLLLPLYKVWQLRLFHFYRKLYKVWRPAAILIQSRDDWLAATRTALKSPFTPQIKVLWLDHMDFRTWVLTNVNHKYKNIIGKRLLALIPKLYKVIFISDYERRHFETLTKGRNFTNLITIKNGSIDRLAEYRNIKPAPQSFCYVGRLADYKGIRELLTAFTTIRATHPGAVLNIYGTGSPDLIAAAKSTPGVAYHGFTDQPLLAIAESQIFILPSYREGLSLSLLDAAMLGRTVIASNVDGNPEVIQHEETGLLVPPRDSAALSAAMERLLTDHHLSARLARNLRRHYEQSFDFAKTVAEQFIPLLASSKSSKR